MLNGSASFVFTFFISALGKRRGKEAKGWDER